MAILVIRISLDFLDESVGSSPSWIILFGTIQVEIPAQTPTIPFVISTLPHTSPFLYTDSSDNDTSERPPSKDPYEIVHQVHHHSSDSSSCHSLPDSSVDAPTTILVEPSRKRGAIIASDYDDSTEESYEAYTEPTIDLDFQADIDADTTAAEAAAASKADVGVEVGIGSDREDEAEEEVESEDRGTIEIKVDRVTGPTVSGDVCKSACDDMHESADERGLDGLMQELTGVLERENMKLRGMLCVEIERIDSLRRYMAYTQEELRQICRFRYYDRMEFRRLKTYARRRLGWKDKIVPDSDGNLTSTTERVFETYKKVTQDIRDQLNAEAEAVQIILTGIYNDIYSTVDACPNACEMWKAVEWS
nr:hypothetical protein [Tanacetum cinerariifolium]